MKEIPYQDFSWNTHQKNWQLNRPNTCQFELTFGCHLHCQYCYTDCYNKPTDIKRELTTQQIKSILDQIHAAGVIWLCLTGGDPLTRTDFLEIYSYAKDKGFIVTIFTNGYSMRKEIADFLKKKPPFVIEITLNAVTREVHERISQVKGSFAGTMKGIELIRKAGLPLKVKTQVTRENLKELPRIKRFLRSRGLGFRPGVFLHARLDGDLTPCSLRISACEALRLDGKTPPEDGDCVFRSTSHASRRTLKRSLFRCAIAGGDGTNIDPYGNILPCSCIREPKINLLKAEISSARKEILEWVRSRRFLSQVKCGDCSLRKLCFNCPGKAVLEEGNLEGIVDWYCQLAHLEAGCRK